MWELQRAEQQRALARVAYLYDLFRRRPELAGVHDLADLTVEAVTAGA